MTVRVGHCLCDTIWARASYRFFKNIFFFFYSTDLHSISFYVYCIHIYNNNKGFVGDS